MNVVRRPLTNGLPIVRCCRTIAPLPRTGQVSRAVALDLLQSAERLDLTDSEWLTTLAGAAKPSIGAGEAYGAILEVTTELHATIHETSRDIMQVIRTGAAELMRLCPVDDRRRWSRMRGWCSYRDTNEDSPHALAAIDSMGIADITGVFADAGHGSMVILCSIRDTPARPSRSMQRFWATLAPHLGRAHALRHRLARGGEMPAAVFDPDGRCSHASPCTAPSTIERLRAHVLGRERSRRRATDTDVIIDAWTAIVGYRWTVVDQFDSDGRRWLVAWDNPLGVADPRALSDLEERILVGLLEGQANVDIARELDMQLPAVSRLLSSALRKLRIRDLGMLASLRGAVAAGIASLSPDRLYAIGIPLVRAEMLGNLTRAEREIVPLLIEGHSNADVALLRGTSERTVANQVHSIYDKLGVGSRRELVRYFGAPMTATVD